MLRSARGTVAWAAILTACAFVQASGRARADQPRDWIIAAQPAGTDVSLDALFPGVQATVEHRIPIYGAANQFTLRANSLLTFPLYESQADVELRILILTLGASGGFRDTFRSQTFEPGESLDRGHRRAREFGGDVKNELWGFHESRASLALPFSDLFVFQSINTLRTEGVPDRTLDWRTGIVHDGQFFRSYNMLFLKHRDWGGIAPVMEILHFDLDNHFYTQINYGVVAVTRPGFRRKNDLLFLQVLFHPGPTLGTHDNSDVYGTHMYFSPIQVTLAYRGLLPVYRPD